MSDSHSFPRSHRLFKPAEYKFVFGKPFKSSDKYFTFLSRPNRRAHARLGLAIAKKNIKTAVARNRIKRLIRESFRLQQQRLKSFDIIVLAKREADKQPLGLLERSIDKHLKKLGD